MVVCLVLLFAVPVRASRLMLLVLDNNSYLVDQALKELDPAIDVKAVNAARLDPDNEKLKAEIDRAEVLIVDVMGRKLENYLIGNINLRNKKIYALRGSVDDERLRRLGFIFDDRVAGYYRNLSRENIANMVRLVAARHLDPTISYGEVKKTPKLGIFHPAADRIFESFAEFDHWRRQRPGFDPGRPTIGVLFFSSYLPPGQKKPIRRIIERLEEENFNVIAAFGRDEESIARYLLDDRGVSRVDLVLAFSLKFYSALTPELGERLGKLQVPVINAIPLFTSSREAWRRSPVGIAGSEVAWAIATPEISGLVEPTPLAAKQRVVNPENGKSYYVNVPIPENIDRLLPRLHNWIKLQRKPDRDKKIALMFYNHSQGKQNVGASYLNVFASIEKIIEALAARGYRVGEPPSEAEIKRLILTSARNIGSWAPGELEKLLRASGTIRLPVARYREWFARLPATFREQVRKQWGEPEDAEIMRDGDDFIIPAVTLGNLVLLPEPSRGWSDDPMKLYHDPSIYPHHQYLAVYLWLQHGFRADAVIHLGTHATYEWNPGKQAGLSPACAPEVLIGDIPSLYPYIVDDVGEGIQAKRRGRGVMISHLTPMLKEVDLYAEYARMAELINEYERARADGGRTGAEKFKALMKLARRTGIVNDLKDELAAAGERRDAVVRLIGHYLEEINQNLMPYGLHCFGRSPADREIEAMSRAVVKWNRSPDQLTTMARIKQSGPGEIAALMAGLEGRRIEPGPGNDPVRNPESLPTGRNFYGFNPARIPTPAAWELGRQAAAKIIADYRKKHQRYPAKVAVVLWATETLRNEGINECTILNLMGIKPKWSKTGRVLGVEAIPGSRLGRPRVDVMVNASGLYRDLFPDKLEFIDDAVQLALRQADIENLIARGTRRLKRKLLAAGLDPAAAEKLSRLRIFAAPPGAYGTGVAEMAGSSGFWEDEKEIAGVYANRVGYAYGRGNWGIAAEKALKANLAGVEVAVHSRSSNVYGLLDNDDMFQYLGALALAVRAETGKSPEVLVTQQQKPGRLEVEAMAKTLGREMRSRYLNPEWISRMQKEDYAGAREMAHFVEYLWGWEVTTPKAVADSAWQQSYEVYVEDKYGLELDRFFRQSSPWAFQSLSARMLEAVRKGYWNAKEEVRRKLAASYAVSVVEKGVACCDHTCNNPLLNQMVVSLISLPGVMNPEMVEKFKLAVEQAAQKSLAEQVSDRRALQAELAAAGPQSERKTEKRTAEKNAGRRAGEREVEGYRMKELKNSDESTELTSSGVEWLAGVVVLLFIALAAWGARRRRNG
ncbi:MAG: cobaltochelatase subunit CobN [Deltaproteobacteria bacterium]|nr:cobaltochelatase subunit CobN [Deltaproteobacteria bacterium]